MRLRGIYEGQEGWRPRWAPTKPGPSRTQLNIGSTQPTGYKLAHMGSAIRRTGLGGAAAGNRHFLCRGSRVLRTCYLSMWWPSFWPWTPASLSSLASSSAPCSTPCSMICISSSSRAMPSSPMNLSKKPYKDLGSKQFSLKNNKVQ